MKVDELIRKLAEKARPVDPEAAARAAGPECLTDEQVRQLIARRDVSAETLRRLSDHAPDCERCWSLIALVAGDVVIGDLAAAEAAVGRAIERHLAGMRGEAKAAVSERLISIAMQWLPGAGQPQVALAGVLADEAEATEATFEVAEEELPLTIRFASPEGVPEGATVVLTTEDGDEVFRGKTDALGEVTFRGPAGRYHCRVEGYDGALLREEDA